MSDHNNIFEASNIINEHLTHNYERVEHSYDEDDKCLLDNAVERLLLEFQSLKIKVKKSENPHRTLTPAERTNNKEYENQEKIARDVNDKFRNKQCANIMVIAQTQSGKTGSMSAIIRQCMTDSDNNIHPDNIFIVTGLSSLEWKEQTKERLPNSLHIYHQRELFKMVDDIKGKKNVLIIMDEVQCAAKKDQTVYKAFNDAGLLNLQHYYDNNIMLVEFTATPDGTIYDQVKWGEASYKMLGKSGVGYTSVFNLLSQGRVKQYQDLCCYDKELCCVNMDKFKENISGFENDVGNYSEPRYHLVRTRTGMYQEITIENFEHVFGTVDYGFITYDKDDLEDINTTLEINPKKHTFIFIKEKLRCAKSLTQTYIGVVYERLSKNPDDGSIIQSLLGRLTGYTNNGESICYTNVDTIRRYKQLWECRWDDMTIKWNSKTTKFKQGTLSGKCTFNELIDDDDSSSDGSVDIIATFEPHIELCNDHEKAKHYYQNVLKPKIQLSTPGYNGRGPNKRKPNATGFYESTIGKGPTRKKVRRYAEIYDARKFALNEDHHYTYHPCYTNITDQSTLIWCLIHKN